MEPASRRPALVVQRRGTSWAAKSKCSVPIPRKERHTQAAALILRNICYYGYLTVSGTQLDGREAGLDLIIGVLELGVVEVEERRSDAT